MIGRAQAGPADPPPVEEIIEGWRALISYHRRTTAAMDERLRATTGHTLDDYDVLVQVAEADEPLKMGELAQRLLVANSSCHRIVGRLADAGHLIRRRGEVDRREVVVELTPSGRRLLRRLAVVHTRDIVRWFGAPLNASEHRGLLRAIRRLDRTAVTGPTATEPTATQPTDAVPGGPGDGVP